MEATASMTRPKMAFPAERMQGAGEGWDAPRRRLAAALVARFNSPFYRAPLLPPIAAQLLELSREAEPDFDRALTLIQQDSLLAGRVLRLVHSPLYRPIEPVRTLREALTRLGLNRVRDFVLSEALHLRVFGQAQLRPVMERLRRHSLAVAQIGEAIARRVGLHPEEAFLCGLLHDIGLAGCIVVASEDPKMSSWLSPAVAMPVLDELHAEAGAIIASVWKLPEAVREVARAHHGLDPRSPACSLSAVICVADHLASEFGAGMHDPSDPYTDYLRDHSDEAALSEASFSLGLAPRQMVELRADASDLVDSLADLG